MFRINHDGESRSRTGFLTTGHGVIETPCFMPVATRATLRTMDSRDLEETNSSMIICNAFLLSLRPGNEELNRNSGIHSFMNWKGSIFTDSGGFQMIRKGFLQKISDQGITLRSPYDGRKISVTPEDVVSWIKSQRPDFGMILDDLPPHGSNSERNNQSVNRTILWAQRSIEHYRSLDLDGSTTGLFAILQGGIDATERRRCIDSISELDFPGHGIGGLSIGESKDEMLSSVDLTTSLLPPEKPVYLMGVGSPVELLECISRGVDIFDSVYPARNARHHTVLTFSGKYSIRTAKNKGDSRPLEDDCQCPICQNYSRSYIHHLVRTGEFGWMRLVSIHNLFFTQRLMKKARIAITENSLGDLVEEVRTSYKK